MRKSTTRYTMEDYGISIQLSGRLVIFKIISKHEYETRSDFRAVSSDLSLLGASQLLAPWIIFESVQV